MWDGTCKGPEVGVSLAYWRNSQEASQHRLIRGTGKVAAAMSEKPAPSQSTSVTVKSSREARGSSKVLSPGAALPRKMASSQPPAPSPGGKGERGNHVYSDPRGKLRLGLDIRNGQNKDTSLGLGGISQVSECALEASQPTENIRTSTLEVFPET